MLKVYAAVVLSILLIGCQDERAEARRKVEVENQAASAKREAERSAELILMINPATALPELKSRLAKWMTPADDGVMITERSRTQFKYSYFVPRRTSWLLKCGITGIEVVISGFCEESSEEGGHTIGRTLTRAKLTLEKAVT